MGAPLSQSGRGDEKKNPIVSPAGELNTGRPARRLVSMLTELLRLYGFHIGI